MAVTAISSAGLRAVSARLSKGSKKALAQGQSHQAWPRWVAVFRAAAEAPSIRAKQFLCAVTYGLGWYR